MTFDQQWDQLAKPLRDKLHELRRAECESLVILRAIEPSDQMKAGGPVATLDDRKRLDAFNLMQDSMREQPVIKQRLRVIRLAQKAGENPILWKLTNG